MTTEEEHVTETKTKAAEAAWKWLQAVTFLVAFPVTAGALLEHVHGGWVGFAAFTVMFALGVIVVGGAHRNRDEVPDA